MSAKDRRKLNWAALGITLLALDGASLLGAHRTWVWLSEGQGAALIRVGQRVGEHAYTQAARRVADAASDLALQAVERTTSVYALMDSLTPGTKASSVHPVQCRVMKVGVHHLKRVAHPHITSW